MHASGRQTHTHTHTRVIRRQNEKKIEFSWPFVFADIIDLLHRAGSHRLGPVSTCSPSLHIYHARVGLPAWCRSPPRTCRPGTCSPDIRKVRLLLFGVRCAVDPASADGSADDPVVFHRGIPGPRRHPWWLWTRISANPSSSRPSARLKNSAAGVQVL